MASVGRKTKKGRKVGASDGGTTRNTANGRTPVIEKRGVPCLIIEYDDEETQPRTWVHVDTGLVLRQEVTQLGKRLILQRDTIIRDP